MATNSESLSSAGTAEGIPGFGGDVFAPGTAEYEAKRRQYASSSYPEKQGSEGSMHPYLIAYPRPDTDDIPAAIGFAKSLGKHIVVRSGGHQYCGLSSGGDDTILLSMDLFNQVEFWDGGEKTFARVGVGTLLTNLAAELKQHGVALPHGECPRVCIGGHAQSGGYGHLLRSYGLNQDHVVEFTIYTADGKQWTVRRPPAQDRTDLFWGVLGGGPGSFGVVTDVTYECIRDKDHPFSWGFSHFLPYEKTLCSTMMNEVRIWTEKVASRDASLPQDVDLAVSLICNKFFDGAALVLEAVNGNRDGEDDGGRNRRFLEQARDNILSGASPQYRSGIPGRGFEGEYPLSFMADAFVRRHDMGEDGREFPLPYKKRLNCDKGALSAAFVSAFVELVDRVVHSHTVKLVVQIFIHGGVYASPDPSPPLTAICHRDVSVGIVFDCFYTPEGLEEAERYQADMQELIDTHWGEEIRMLWGSFGDTDISKEHVRRYYYDDATWKDLQKLKQQMDGGDLFHTEFTVQLPRAF
jgi:FAD/FMN-containing dehydrogenase